MNRMLAVIEELSEELNEPDLVELLNWYPNKSALQRFGFLLEQHGINEEFQELIFMNLKTTNFFRFYLAQSQMKNPEL